MSKRLYIKNVYGLEDSLVESPNAKENLVEIISDDGMLPESPISSANLVEVESSIETSFNEGNQICEDIKTADSDLLLLNKLQDNISSKIESGEGISDDTATLVQQTLENMYKRHGVCRGILSIESFKNKRTRLYATKVTLESIIDLIGSIGKYISKKFISFVEWWKDQWERIKDFLTDNYKNLLLIKEGLKKVKGMRDLGKPVQIKWLGKHIFTSNQAEAKWDVASSNLKNVLRATDLERKAWKQIQEYLGNTNKNMKEFMKMDPYGLAKFSPYLGVGFFMKRDSFNNKGSVIQSIEVPSVPKLMEFIDDGLTLVGPAAVNQYDNIQAEIFRYEDMVTDYNYETGTTYGDKGPVLTVTSKAEVKKEYQIAIDLARDLMHTFWQMRCKAARSVGKLANYFALKHGKGY